MGAIVVGPGKGEKAVLDELVVSVLGGLSTKPHFHRNHTDLFYVFEGDFDVAGIPLSAGDIGYAPPGAVHWFEAPSATFLNVHAPGSAWKLRSLARREGKEIDDAASDSFDPPDDFTPEAVVVAAAEGEVITDGDATITVKVARPELCLFEFDVAPGYNGPRPHVHRTHVDAFAVLEGALEFVLDDDSVRAEAGTFVAAMPGVAHAFANPTERRVRFLNLHAPGVKSDEYMRRLAAGEERADLDAAFDVYTKA